MAETYPSNVPNLVVTGSISSVPIDSVLKHKVDVGKGMSRNKYTGELFNTSWRIMMNSTQLTALMDWYHNTLGKVLSFDFPEPLTGVDREYTFIRPPESVHLGGDNYYVTYNLRSISGYSTPDIDGSPPVSASLTQRSGYSRSGYSFDTQQTLYAPNNTSAPEFNSVRFSLT